MKHTKLEMAIEAWGRARQLEGPAALDALIQEHRIPTRMVKALGLRESAVPTLREFLRDAGRYKPFRFEDRVKELGYENARAFFLANKEKTYASMAELLGCTWMAVQKQYERAFQAELEASKGGPPPSPVM